MKKLFTLLLCLGALSASATIWRLNNNPAVDADFRTFAEAQEAAEAGDTIFVEGNGISNHYGYLNITKKLILIGPGFFLTQNDSVVANKVVARAQRFDIQATAAGTEIYGLYFENEDGFNPYNRIYASNVVISRNYFGQLSWDVVYIGASVQNVTIIQNYMFKIEVRSTDTASNLLIANNFIGDRILMNSLSNAIITNNIIHLVADNVFNSQIKNNIILSAQYADPVSAANGTNYIAWNILPGTLPSGNLGPGNQGSVNMSTVFEGYPTQGEHSNDGRFMLSTESPALGAGESGIDCGIFGGSLPYVLSGQPAVPRVYEAVVPTAGSTSAGLPVIIKIKSQN